ncbi:uncharacterized protein PFL1_06712 [Pseudozyma flocculosa PF-1]|uniref:DUF7918 domain-containing protein n=2 Tax=Pseudozyma flocculosa TaxID=84751 RepID=A0A5C3F4M7_9BASI|nr:uncharacterized protein PFL1_06712 [Pseudozyma flocculosa PF-1]EPQ25718.1 hypothetical protein PFL1_06712 [Pseudozyma flocculosa PF-1]SPO38906.1 uncharacterized protein PSFLO_04385 [Pseudozyma flocculosa]
MHLNGFDTTIHLVDTKDKLDEYKVELDGTRKISAHVCSVDEAAFGITVARAHEERRDIHFDLTFDGRVVPGLWLFKKHEPYKSINKLFVGRDSCRNMLFSKVGDAASSDNTPAASQLGTIVVRLYAAEVLGKKRRTWYGSEHNTPQVDDKALKERKKSDGLPLSHHINRRLSCEPFATFRFVYASGGILEACEIVPSAIDKVPASQAGDLTRELELQATNDELKRQLALMQQRLHRLKRERPAGSADDADVIDLTLDDDDDGNDTGGTGIQLSDDSGIQEVDGKSNSTVGSTATAKRRRGPKRSVKREVSVQSGESGRTAADDAEEGPRRSKRQRTAG